MKNKKPIGKHNKEKLDAFRAEKQRKIAAKKKLAVGDDFNGMIGSLFESAFGVVEETRDPLDNPLKELVAPCRVFLDDPDGLSPEVLKFSEHVVLLEGLWDNLADEEKTEFNGQIFKEAKQNSRDMVDGMRSLVQNIVSNVK